MSQPIAQVDAFTSTPFAGNPAAVCVLTESRDDRWMQQVATEMNLAETAFVRARAGARDAGFDLRWFTPTAEVDLCGHATLATAHLLWEDGRLARDAQARFRTRSGLLTADRATARIELDFPATPDEPVAPPDGLAAALGAAPRYVARSRFDYLVELDDEAAVRALEPDFGALARVGMRGVIVDRARRGRRRGFRLALLRASRRHRRGSGDRLGALLSRALLGPAPRQDRVRRAPDLGARRRPQGRASPATACASAVRRHGAPGRVANVGLRAAGRISSRPSGRLRRRRCCPPRRRRRLRPRSCRSAVLVRDRE